MLLIPETVAFTGIAVGIAAAFWAKLKDAAWKAVNLVIAQAFVSGQAEKALTTYLLANSKPSRFGEKLYSGWQIFVRPKGRREEVAWEQVSSDETRYWLGWRVVWVKRDSRTVGDEKLEGLVISFVRYTFDMEDLLLAAMAHYNHVLHGYAEDPEFNFLNGGTFTWNEDNSAPIASSKNNYSRSRKSRYRVHRVVGSGMSFGLVGSGKELSAKPSSHRGDRGIQMAPPDARPLGWTRDQLGDPQPADPFEFLAYPPEVLRAVEEARWWRSAEKEYKSRGVPWRYGWAFTGPPGTGKTSLTRAICQDLDMPLFHVELGTMTDRELVDAWREARDNAPSAVLLEDFDTVFNGREVVPNGPKGLTFSCLLNCLSGAEEANGVVVFLTTNRAEALDEALGVPDPATGRSSRPGRISRFVEFGPLTREGREKVAGKILAGFPEAAAELVAAGEGQSGNVFQQMCIERAFELLNAADAKAVPEPPQP